MLGESAATWPTEPRLQHRMSPFSLCRTSAARNAELNLGYPSTQYTYLVQEWFDHFWDASEPYPLEELYAARWEPHTPWAIFLRMLWELYGAQLNADTPLPGVRSVAAPTRGPATAASERLPRLPSSCSPVRRRRGRSGTDRRRSV